MKPSHKLVTTICFSVLIFSCNNRSSEPTQNYSALDSTGTEKTIASSSAAVENNKDTTRKFIRTADIKFKVNSVINSTYNIEDIVNRQGGFVTYTNLLSNIDNVTTIPVSADSSLETTSATVTNSIIVRIPNTKLDTTLKEIAKNIDYLDYRIIKAEDVALQIISNNMAQKRSAKNTERLSNAIDNKGKKLDEITNAEDQLSDKEERSDEAIISNLSMADQIKFSTVNLMIYQRPDIKKELVATYKTIDAYEPGLGSQILASLKYGWKIIEALFVFLVKFWGLLLGGAIAYIIYKKYSKRVKE